MAEGATVNGKRFRELRLRKGWKREELAHKSDLNVKTIARAESGKGVHIATLTLIARALDVDVAELIAEEQKRGTLEIIVAIKFNNFDEEQKAAIEEFFKKIVPNGGEVIITKYEESNSTKVILEMDLEDIQRILLHFRRSFGGGEFPIKWYYSPDFPLESSDIVFKGSRFEIEDRDSLIPKRRDPKPEDDPEDGS